MNKKQDGGQQFNLQFPAEAGVKLSSISHVEEDYSNQVLLDILQDLRAHKIELEMQNEELHGAYLALQETRDRYVQLYDFAPVGYFTLTENGLITEANLTFGTLLGVERYKLINSRFAKYLLPEDFDRWHLHCMYAKQYLVKHNCELTLTRPDETVFQASLDCLARGVVDTPPLIYIAITDITAQKQAENILLEARQHLENEVATTKLELEERKEETKMINTALKVLINHREADKDEAQSALLGQIEETIMPFLKKLKGSSTGRHQSNRLISILENNLQLLVKSYGKATKLSAAFHQLTPIEIQVVSLLKQGLSTKLIATTLNIATGTVSIHRKHIRRKLSLHGKANNLQSYLKSLSE
jgi:PAS domain S-box-containing protein